MHTRARRARRGRLAEQLLARALCAAFACCTSGANTALLAVLGAPGNFWALPGCSRLLAGLPDCPRLLLAARGCSLAAPRLHWSRLLQVVGGPAGHNDALGHTTRAANKNKKRSEPDLPRPLFSGRGKSVRPVLRFPKLSFPLLFSAPCAPNALYASHAPRDPYA